MTVIYLNIIARNEADIKKGIKVARLTPAQAWILASKVRSITTA